MYATDRRQTDRHTPDVRQKHRLIPRLLGAGHNNARSCFIARIVWNCGSKIVAVNAEYNAKVEVNTLRAS